MHKSYILAFINGLLIGSLTYLVFLLVLNRPNPIPQGEILSVLLMSGCIGLATRVYMIWEDDHFTLALSLHFACVFLLVSLTALYNGWIELTWMDFLPFTLTVVGTYLLVWLGMLWHRQLEVATTNHLIQERRQKASRPH